MRSQDRDELAAFGERDPLTAVVESLRASSHAASVFVNDELACIFGVARIGGLVSAFGAPWLLGTQGFERHARILARQAPAYTAQMLALYPVLRNRVHASNTVSRRWLERLGFTLGPEQPDGSIYFELRKCATFPSR